MVFINFSSYPFQKLKKERNADLHLCEKVIDENLHVKEGFQLTKSVFRPCVLLQIRRSEF